jgi:hypothetical protein
LGTAGFLFLVGVTLVNSRRVVALTRGRTAPPLRVLSRLAVATQIAILLLLFEGLFLNNICRYNWLWLAAFSALALRFVRQSAVRTGEVGVERSPQPTPHLV